MFFKGRNAAHWLLRAAVNVVLLACFGAAARADEQLSVLPGEFTLTGPHAWQTLLVERSLDGRFVGQPTGEVKWESSDPKIVAIEDGEARPVANGEVTLTATVGATKTTAKVKVVAMDQPALWSFRNHVESVLAKAGCSSGACHGAHAGKNGFKLSLRGYDPDGDFRFITRQAQGRRVIPTDPGRSLLLLKPTAVVPHKGGIRFQPGSLEYRVLAEWIAAGTPSPQPNDARLVRLEILPSAIVLKPKDTQQLLVRAHFTDGHTEDVTRWAMFTSTNETMGSIDNAGKITIMGHGEGAITAWYLSKVVAATVSSPYDNPTKPEMFASAPRKNFIDNLVLDKLQSLNIPPSPVCSDNEFVRRVFLDTIGVLPTADETRAFLADTGPNKRDVLIDKLLERPEFIDYWTYKWADLLLVSGEKLRPPAMWAYYSWVRNKVEANTPWDQLVREVVTAKGSTLENGAANFFVLHQDPLELAETTTVAFLGMSINCARCHNHPLEKWTNNQYYAFANLYARVRTKVAPGDGNTVVFSGSEGDLIQPLTGKPQTPTPLDAEPLTDATVDRREYLAKWLTSPENPYFARAITNRVWANFFSTGLVELVDDMRQTNPASNELLLAALSKHLVEQHYDLKALMRTILQSSTYQRTSQAQPGAQEDTRFYSHYYPRRLMAEVLLDALSTATATPTEFPEYPKGWRALQLPNPNIESYFLKAFGRPERLVTCTCERNAEPTMVQVLHLTNGTALNAKLQQAGNRLDALLAQKISDEQRLDELYLAALSRAPSAHEKEAALAVLTAATPDTKRATFEDVAWAVLSSKEFLFNH